MFLKRKRKDSSAHENQVICDENNVMIIVSM